MKGEGEGVGTFVTGWRHHEVCSSRAAEKGAVRDREPERDEAQERVQDTDPHTSPEPLDWYSQAVWVQPNCSWRAGPVLGETGRFRTGGRAAETRDRGALAPTGQACAPMTI